MMRFGLRRGHVIGVFEDAAMRFQPRKPLAPVMRIGWWDWVFNCFGFSSTREQMGIVVASGKMF